MNRTRWLPLVACAALLAFSPVPGRGDSVELKGGSQAEGTLVARDSRYVTLRVVVGGRELTRRFPLDRVAAITVDGKREVLDGSSSAPSSPAVRQDTAPGRPPERSAEEVMALVQREGRATPEWWNSVALAYPETLDLSWPMPAPAPWNNQRNIGQYVWDVINHNPGKWREGVRFMHHVLSVNQSNREVAFRAMSSLGRMYHDLLADYARAAFWWKQAGVDRLEYGSLDAVHLAECYWRLGSKAMAMELLSRLPPHFAMIKLWADMGETDQALRMAEANMQGAVADIACIYAGEACRVAGRYADALNYYNRLLAMRPAGYAAKRIERNQQRARANVEAIRLFETLDLARVPDGTYRSSSMGYEAPVQVDVTVRAGRIEAVEVTAHREKQFYSALTDTPQKIIAKQSVKGIDATSSATITSDAIVNATAKALAGAAK